MGKIALVSIFEKKTSYVYVWQLAEYLAIPLGVYDVGYYGFSVEYGKIGRGNQGIAIGYGLDMPTTGYEPSIV